FVLLLAGPAVRAEQPKSAAGQAKRPNILFIAVDDLNDWVGVLGGHPQARTPHLDRLAGRGCLFTRAYCPAPLCNPSRTAVLTGLRPSTTGVYLNNQPWRPAMPDAVTLLQYLRANGYLVLGGGKIFHYNDAKSWDQHVFPKNKVPAKEYPERGIGGNMIWGPLKAGDSDLTDGQLSDWAIGKLKEKHDRPFCLAVGYIKPHLPWYAPKKYFDMHPLDKIQLPKVLDNDLDDVPPAGIKMAKPEGDHRQIVKAGLWKEAVQAYLACSSYMDAQLGRLLEALAQSPYADNTIIILWSDHGWHHGQKQHWRKFALWEQTCRVTFTITAPGVTQPAQRCARTVNLLDIYPTVLDLCGLPAKKGLEGHSLVPLLRDPQAPWDHPSLTTYGRNNHSLRTERWRYIRYRDGSEELYDHDNDPLEWKNLAKDPRYTELKKDLASKLPKVNAADVPAKKEKQKEKNKLLPTAASDLLLRASPMTEQPPERPWRTLPLITGGKVDKNWAQIGWGGFVVENGSLRTECDERGMGLLLYQKERFGNCQIRVVYKVKDARSNSGVFVRIADGILERVNEKTPPVERDKQGKLSKEMLKRLMEASAKEQGPWYAVHHGYEVQICDDADAYHRTGAIYSLAKSAGLPKPSSDWRTLLITLKGNLVLVDLDGKRVTTFDPEGKDVPKAKAWHEPRREPQRPQVGYLGLQNHDPGDVVYFKEVSVRPLGDAP
ncbi:MAG TPA: sulfatase-like hydrolase/transferase, partial [Gemmataceae bacterium]|nr:sulfatase-like hydrolase/transferase [Gemmataceae bacterium]